MPPRPEAAEPPLPAAWVRRSFLLLAVFFTLRAVISATLAVHLIAVLGGLGLSVAGAVAASALLGPSQVGGGCSSSPWAARRIR